MNVVLYKFERKYRSSFNLLIINLIAYYKFVCKIDMVHRVLDIMYADVLALLDGGTEKYSTCSRGYVVCRLA